MKGLMILASIIIWVLSIANPQLGQWVYLLWLAAFTLMFFGWSLFFSITSLIAIVSSVYLDLSSPSMFISTFLPWCCGICTFTIFISLVAKYAAVLGGDANVSGSSGSFFGGGDGGGDGGC